MTYLMCLEENDWIHFTRSLTSSRGVCLIKKSVFVFQRPRPEWLQGLVLHVWDQNRASCGSMLRGGACSSATGWHGGHCCRVSLNLCHDPVRRSREEVIVLNLHWVTFKSEGRIKSWCITGMPQSHEEDGDALQSVWTVSEATFPPSVHVLWWWMCRDAVKQDVCSS